MAETGNHSIDIESSAPNLIKLICRKPTGKRLAAIYRQEIIQDVTLFTSQSAAKFYDKLFSSLDFTLLRAATGRRGFPKEALVCAFIVMKCEGFSQITGLMRPKWDCKQAGTTYGWPDRKGERGYCTTGYA